MAPSVDERRQSRDHRDPRQREREQHQDPGHGEPASTPAEVRKPMSSPTDDDDHDRDGVGHHRGQHVPPQHRRPRDRHGVEPFEDAALHVVEQPEAGVGDAAGDRDEQDAGHQVVGVVAGAGLDGAAEHVAEQQHERDRHDRDGDDGVHAAGDVPDGTAEHSPVSLKTCALMTALARLLSDDRRGRSPPGWAGLPRVRPSRREQLLSSARVPETMIVPWCRIAIRSASFSASSRYWVVSSTVVARCRRGP